MHPKAIDGSVQVSSLESSAIAKLLNPHPKYEQLNNAHITTLLAIFGLEFKNTRKYSCDIGYFCGA
jgi:hypothetical protein